MKSVISIALIFILSYNFLGAGVVYNVWLYSIKNEVKHSLRSEFSKEHKIIKVPKSWADSPPPEFKWHEEHEFWYQGQMYDVIRSEKHGNQIWYYAYWDKAETKLLNNLSKYISSFLKQQPDQQKKTQHLIIILKNVFLLFENSYLSNINPSFFSLVPEDTMLIRRFQDVETPPPRDTIRNLCLLSTDF